MATARPIGECRKAVDQFAGSKTDRLVTHGSFHKSAQLYTQIEELAVTLIIRVKASLITRATWREALFQRCFPGRLTSEPSDVVRMKRCIEVASIEWFARSKALLKTLGDRWAPLMPQDLAPPRAGRIARIDECNECEKLIVSQASGRGDLRHIVGEPMGSIRDFGDPHFHDLSPIKTPPPYGIGFAKLK
jgi:hypothetical protein